MFEKLKEYSLYIILGLIALGSLSYAYISVTNTQRGALIDENNSKAIMNTLIKTDQQKQGLTVAEELLKINGGKNIGNYKIDDSKVSYVIGETYDDILNNSKLSDISSSLDVSDGQVRTILISSIKTNIQGKDIKSVNLNSNQTITVGDETISKTELKNIGNELKGYNISAIGYGPFDSQKEAKNFRNSYFSKYEVYQIGSSGKYIVLQEYEISLGSSRGSKTLALNNTGTGGGTGTNPEDPNGGEDPEDPIIPPTPEEQDCQEVYLDSNGITMKAKDTINCGQEYSCNGTKYYVACTKNDIQSKIFDEGYQANRIITTKVKTFMYLFNGKTTFNEDISNWDTSNVTNMNGTFLGASTFNQDISNWNTSKVTNMENMFFNATNFNQPIGNWDISKVNTIMLMFYGASKFNQPLNDWNTSNITNFDSTFFFASSFNQPLDKWNTSNVANMQNMFHTASSFDQDISNWNVENVNNHHDFDYNTLSSWTSNEKPKFNTCNEYLCLDANGVTMKSKSATTCGNEYEFDGKNYYVACNKNDLFDKIKDGYQSNRIITTKITNMSHFIEGIEDYSFNDDISNWDVSNVTDMSYMFRESSLDQDLIYWNTSKVKDMSYMFDMAYNFNGDITTWNTSSVTNMSNLFSMAESFNQPIGSWNTSSVTNMSNLFSMAESFNQPIGNWNTSKVTNMEYMFESAYEFNQPIGNWNVSNVTNMNNMFSGASNFNQDIGKWNISKVSNLSNMFASTQFNNGGSDSIKNWNTGNVTNMSSMFSYVENFNQPIGNWNVSNVTNMNLMFSGAESFNQSLDGWNVSNVINMRGLFRGATQFNNGGSDGIKNWNTSNVVYMDHMFEGAKVFNQDIGKWNTQNVEKMDNMFSGAKAFNQDISGRNVHKLITHKYFDSGSNVNWTSNKKPHLSCTNDTDERTLNYSNCEPALYVDTNGVTIKAKPFARPGKTYKLNGKTYYVAKNTIGLFPYTRDNLLNSKRDTENLFSGKIGCLDLRLQLSGGKYTADSIVTTKCTNMQNLFFDTWFNQPIGNWDVSNVTNMNNMFNENSSFNQNISNWNVTKVTNHQNFDKNTTNWNSNYKPVFN